MSQGIAMAAPEAILRLENISKIYQMGDVSVPALQEVSLTVAEGDFVAVMGASGSGKSTLMNILGCLDRPTSGRYYLGDQDVSSLDRNALAEIRNQTIGFVFQNFNLLNRTTALENVELPLLYGGVANRERQTRAREALERVGLGDRIRHYSNQMSGGQQQRVALARALVSRPKIILADEPTGNLDSRTSLEIMALLQDLDHTGITVIIVTHSPDVAAYVSRVLFMKDGRIISDRRQEPQKARLEMPAQPTARGDSAL